MNNLSIYEESLIFDNQILMIENQLYRLIENNILFESENSWSDIVSGNINKSMNELTKSNKINYDSSYLHNTNKNYEKELENSPKIVQIIIKLITAIANFIEFVKNKISHFIDLVYNFILKTIIKFKSNIKKDAILVTKFNISSIKIYFENTKKSIEEILKHYKTDKAEDFYENLGIYKLDFDFKNSFKFNGKEKILNLLKQTSEIMNEVKLYKNDKLKELAKLKDELKNNKNSSPEEIKKYNFKFKIYKNTIIKLCYEVTKVINTILKEWSKSLFSEDEENKINDKLRSNENMPKNKEGKYNIYTRKGYENLKYE